MLAAVRGEEEMESTTFPFTIAVRSCATRQFEQHKRITDKNKALYATVNWLLNFMMEAVSKVCKRQIYSYTPEACKNLTTSFVLPH